MMQVIWGSLASLGYFLILWSMWALPKGTSPRPIPPAFRVFNGPYRFFKHPMYIGNIMFVTGLAGLAAGFWNALAVFTVAELLMRDWAWREES